MRKFLATACLLSAFSAFATPPQKDTGFSERYGLWFMFESTCSPCLKLAPELYDFINKHNIKTIAISKDAKPLRTWQGEWRRNLNATLYRLGIEEYPTPTLVLDDSLTGVKTPIGVGYMTEEQLNQRIYELTDIQLGAKE